MSSTFQGLFIAKSGVQAARANLNTTGQNISNANTAGYTRQRVDQYAIPPTCIGMLYAQSGAVSGEGVTTTGITQLRNPYLDSQFRSQNAECGTSSTMLSCMNDIEKILNESTTDGLSAQFGNLITQLQGLTSNGNGSSTESTVKNAASLLCTFFNTAANNLDSTHDAQLGYLQKYAVGQANTLMRDIATLNRQIQSASIAGTPALELQDQRNSMIDELSQYVNIQVTEVDTGGLSVKGQPVTNLTITLVDKDGKAVQATDKDGNPLKGTDGNPIPVTLVSNDTFVQFDTKEAKTAEDLPPYGQTTVTISERNTEKVKSPDKYTDLSDSAFSSGTISGYLTLLNQNGDFGSDENEDNSAKGIGYYKQILNRTAQKFAELMNQANSASGDKPLFTSDGTSSAEIDASNITVAEAWTVGNNYLTTTKKAENAGDDNTSGTDNVLAMIRLLTGDHAVEITNNDTDKKVIFSGSMQGAVDDIALRLGQDIGSLKSQSSADASTLNDIDTGRQELSSVDINEEAINLIQYNQSLSASARFMTTIDEVLNTIINNMGIAGR